MDPRSCNESGNEMLFLWKANWPLRSFRLQGPSLLASIAQYGSHCIKLVYSDCCWQCLGIFEALTRCKRYHIIVYQIEMA